MRSITDEILRIDIPSQDEFTAYWQKWVNSDLGIAYRVFLGEKYDIQEPHSLPYPSFDKNAEEDEQLSQVLEQCLLIKEIRNDREAFLERMEENNLSFTNVYQAFVLEVARLWYKVNPTPAMIRRIWYKGFKVFGQYLRENEFSESDYGLLISACSNWVSRGLMFYSNFFVQDTTRKIFANNRDRGWHNVFLACEKDSAVNELKDLGSIIGAKFVISGHGVPSMAACEKSLVLRQLQYIKDYHADIKDIILVIVSDYDHAGMNGVAGGFVQQFNTFCNNVGLNLIHERVGLLPHHVPDHRLKPSFALYSPPLRGVIRCKVCTEIIYVCNSCGKGVKRKKEPKICTQKNKEGNPCGGSSFTIVEVGTKVQARDSKSGFLRKDDRNLVKANPSMASRFINRDECPSCGEIKQELSLEANNWSRVFGVPFCITHDECHTNDYNEFSNEEEFLLDETCVIERYGIELDALGASYYFSEITDFIHEQLGIDGVSEWSRKQQTPEYYEYESVVTEIVDKIASENEVYSKIKAEIDNAEDILSDLNTAKESVVEKLSDILVTRKDVLLEEPNWDDRQREWDEDIEIYWYKCDDCDRQWHDSEEHNICPDCHSGQITQLIDGNWSEESVKEMHETHWKLVRHSVLSKKDFSDYFYGTLGFTKKQLQDKLNETLNEEIENDEIDLPELDEESPYLGKSVQLFSTALPEAFDKLISLMVKAKINSDDFDIEFDDDEYEIILERINAMKEAKESEDSD